MFLFQPMAASVAEPIVVGASLVAGGGVIVWFAKTAIETRDTVRNMATALYDDTTGLIKTVYQDRQNVQGALGQLSNETNALDKRVTRVEDRCGLNHPHNGNGEGS